MMKLEQLEHHLMHDKMQDGNEISLQGAPRTENKAEVSMSIQIYTKKVKYMSIQDAMPSKAWRALRGTDRMITMELACWYPAWFTAGEYW
jgi:hypothetical protein